VLDELVQACLANALPNNEWDEKHKHDADQNGDGNPLGLIYCITRVLIECIEYFAVEP
jgi:hypothetical protein